MKSLLRRAFSSSSLRHFMHGPGLCSVACDTLRFRPGESPRNICPVTP